MEMLAGMTAITGVIGPAVLLVVAIYFFAVWDQRKADSETKDDGQIGIKVAIMLLVLIGIGIAAAGAQLLLHYLLSGAKAGGTPQIKSAIAFLLVGGLVVAIFLFLFLPRTNSKDYPKVTRMTAGLVAVISGTAAIVALTMFVNLLILGGGGWAGKSQFLAAVVVFGGLGIGALVKLGGLSGWTAPVRPVAPQPSAGYGQPGMAQPGMQPGMQQQGGYPPQGGGYPPQGGGYPPQGGGYPPQGGGYPPQGGGY
jgi:hypothetical protein